MIIVEFKEWIHSIPNYDFNIEDLDMYDILFFCGKGYPFINHLILIIKYHIYIHLSLHENTIYFK